jgi:hypothetical protein
VSDANNLPLSPQPADESLTIANRITKAIEKEMHCLQEAGVKITDRQPDFTGFFTPEFLDLLSVMTSDQKTALPYMLDAYAQGYNPNPVHSRLFSPEESGVIKQAGENMTAINILYESCMEKPSELEPRPSLPASPFHKHGSQQQR